MFCPRLNHFRRVNASGSIGLCGHMVNGPRFKDLSESDDWAIDRIQSFANNIWPNECVRCKDAESMQNKSIRQYSIDAHKDYKAIKKDYLIIGGTLDSYCNSACISCNPDLSTRIASLHKSPFVNDNTSVFENLPHNRIIQLDINGGEPAYSKNYQKILKNLPKNLVQLRINTNGSRVIPNLEKILKDNEKLTVTITLSLDGVGEVHDYARWPIKWIDYVQNVDKYINLKNQYSNLELNFWVTLSVLNLHDFENIKNFSQEKSIPYSFAYLERPACLSVKKTNWITSRYKGSLGLVASEESNDEELKKFLHDQENLRNIQRIETLTIY